MTDLFVGIDPSFTATGVVALTRDSGVLAAVGLRLKAEGRSDLDRAIAIADAVQAVVEDCGQGTTVKQVAIEGYSIESKFRVAMLATLGTVLRLRLRNLLWPYVEPAPTQVKNFALMPNKRAKKAKPVAECEQHWGFVHKSNDVIDAYVLAQIARAVGGAQLIGHLHMRQIDVLAGLKQN